MAGSSLAGAALDQGQIHEAPCCTFPMAMAGACVTDIETRGGKDLRRRGVEQQEEVI